MKLNKESLADIKAWEAAGIAAPSFDYAKMQAHTRAHPVWVHFGAGNIFRGYVARLQQELIEAGHAQSGIIAAESFDTEILDKIYAPHDNLALLVELNADGSTGKSIVAGVAEAMRADDARLADIFRSSELQFASFTITEKGYAPNADDPANAMRVVAGLMLERYKAGAHPIALVSMDNCSRNGDKLRDGILAVAKTWGDAGFSAYLADTGRVAFPWSMIDKIVPRPDERVGADLEAAGVQGMAPVVTGRGTYIAPFVNAEAAEYLVIEDSFPNGRPPLDKAGVYFTDRETVENTERMKVTTCLNPLHTALAIFGCLLGYTRISDEMRDADLLALVELIGYQEGLPVVVNPGIIDPREFLRDVLELRLPNPFIPDAPQRIATDTSQKIAIRFCETIKSYLARPELDASSLTGIPLVIAGWMRYLLAVGDDGKQMQVSSDPLLEQLQARLSGVALGKPESHTGQIRQILADSALFTVDLEACGLAGKIEEMFTQMLAGEGAVRATLKRRLK